MCGAGSNFTDFLTKYPPVTSTGGGSSATGTGTTSGINNNASSNNNTSSNTTPDLRGTKNAVGYPLGNGDMNNPHYQGLVREDMPAVALHLTSQEASTDYAYQGQEYNKQTNSFQQNFTEPMKDVNRTVWVANADYKGQKIGDKYTESNTIPGTTLKYANTGTITGVSDHPYVQGWSNGQNVRDLVQRLNPGAFKAYQQMNSNDGGKFLQTVSLGLPGHLITYDFKPEARQETAKSIYNAYKYLFTESTNNIEHYSPPTIDYLNTTNDATRFINSGPDNNPPPVAAAPAVENHASNVSQFQYAQPKDKVRRPQTIFNSSPTGGDNSQTGA